MLVAGGTIRQETVISVNGGTGGACVASTLHPSASTASPGSGGGGGRIAIYAQSIHSPAISKLNVAGGHAGACSHNVTAVASTIVGSTSNSGAPGSDYVSAMSNVSWYINTDFGALGTKRSLVLSGGPHSKTSYSPQRPD